MSRTPWPLLLAVLGACESSAPDATTPPRILSVYPLSQRSDESRVVTVQLDVEPSLLVDYGTGTARRSALPELSLGDATTVTLDTYLGHGQYLGRVGPVAYGAYELQVRLEDGRAATFVDAPYVVKRSINYAFASVGPQRAGTSFTLTLNIDVKDTLPFAGKAWLQRYQGGRESGLPQEIGPLVEGENPVPYVVPEPGGDYVIRLTDDQDNDATSQTFPVEQ